MRMVSGVKCLGESHRVLRRIRVQLHRPQEQMSRLIKSLLPKVDDSEGRVGLILIRIQFQTMKQELYGGLGRTIFQEDTSEFCLVGGLGNPSAQQLVCSTVC